MVISRDRHEGLGRSTYQSNSPHPNHSPPAESIQILSELVTSPFPTRLNHHYSVLRHCIAHVFHHSFPSEFFRDYIRSSQRSVWDLSPNPLPQPASLLLSLPPPSTCRAPLMLFKLSGLLSFPLVHPGVPNQGQEQNQRC